jgi:hypothetical protein
VAARRISLTKGPGPLVKQMARNLVDPAEGFLRGATHLIHDRDPLFTESFTAVLKSGGVECVKIPALGYGEDALTLWVFTSRLPAFLSELGDLTRKNVN